MEKELKQTAQGINGNADIAEPEFRNFAKQLFQRWPDGRMRTRDGHSINFSWMSRFL